MIAGGFGEWRGFGAFQRPLNIHKIKRKLPRFLTILGMPLREGFQQPNGISRFVSFYPDFILANIQFSTFPKCLPKPEI